jgi:transcriptional regulator with XRE-family HTH domain
MTMHSTDEFTNLINEALDDPDVRAAAHENTLRRQLADVIRGAQLQRGWSVRQLADEIGTSPSQVQRLLHREQGGSLTLRTVCRAADKLGLRVSLHLRPVTEAESRLVPFGNVSCAGWSRATRDPIATVTSPSHTCAVRGSNARDNGWESASRWVGGAVMQEAS